MVELRMAYICGLRIMFIGIVGGVVGQLISRLVLTDGSLFIRVARHRQFSGTLGELDGTCGRVRWKIPSSENTS